MRRLTTAVLALLFLACVAGEAGTYWKFNKVLFRSYSYPHSIAMDPRGNIWIDNYRSGSRYDSLFVFDQQGVQLPFSPVWILSAGGKNDTVGNGRGLVRDLAGNIIWGGSTFNTDGAGTAGFGLFRINSVTGQLMSKVVLTQYPSQPGIDNQGNVWYAGLLPPWSAEVYDSTLANKLGTPITGGSGYPRSSTVDPDAKRFWMADYMYTSPTGNQGFFDDYTVDTNWTKVWGGSLIETHAWDRNGNLWVSKKTNRTYYCLDKTSLQIIDSLKSDLAVDGPDTLIQPHGICFSVTGDTAFTAELIGAGVKMWVRTATGVTRTDYGVPEAYTMSQNYPNPFNPSTEIQFSIPRAGFTTVKVYDMLGKEVATLVAEELNPGTFTTRLDGSSLASGTYIYRMVSGSTVMTKKMMLLK